MHLIFQQLRTNTKVLNDLQKKELKPTEEISMTCSSQTAQQRLHAQQRSTSIITDAALLQSSVPMSPSNPNLIGWMKLKEAVLEVRHYPEKYFRCISLIQSSGYGKTKACFDLMDSHRASSLYSVSKQPKRNFTTEDY